MSDSVPRYDGWDAEELQGKFSVCAVVAHTFSVRVFYTESKCLTHTVTPPPPHPTPPFIMSSTTIYMGAMIPFSGGWSPYVLPGYLQALDDINISPYILPNVHINGTYADSECDPRGGVKGLLGMEKLVEGWRGDEGLGLDVVIGDGCSSACQAEGPITEVLRIPQISWGCSAGEEQEHTHKHTHEHTRTHCIHTHEQIHEQTHNYYERTHTPSLASCATRERTSRSEPAVLCSPRTNCAFRAMALYDARANFSRRVQLETSSRSLLCSRCV